MSKLRNLVRSNNNPLLQVIITANFNYKSWWIFVGLDRPKYADMLNKYYLYFSGAIHSHLFTLIISLYKLYDPKRQTNSINKLINYAKKDGGFNAKEIKQLKTCHQKAIYIWEKVKILRHKYYAHLQFDATPENVYEEAKITPDEFKELIEISLDIVNIIRFHFQDSDFRLVTPEEDLYRMLNDLKV